MPSNNYDIHYIAFNDPPPDALSKTYDAVWDGKRMVIRELEVVINPPYTEDSIVSDNAKAKQRVALVLNGELKKLGSA